MQLTGRVWGRMHHGSLAELEQDVVNAQLAVQLRIQLHRDNSLRNGVATHATIICADRPPSPRATPSEVPRTGRPGPATRPAPWFPGAAGHPAVRRRGLRRRRSSLKGGDVQLAHAEHCLHGALGAGGVGATDQLFQH